MNIFYSKINRFSFVIEKYAMVLKQISILNFKNHHSVELDFPPSINCFTGNNGVGKTNLLDAIHYLSICKSYFNPIDSQNICHDQEFFMIEGIYDIDGKEEKISCGIKRNQKKKFSRNKKEYKKLSEHIGLLPIVMVSPSDIRLILEGSEERRKFLDAVIAQYDKDYLDSIIKYNKALLQRNTLLKHFAEKNRFNENELEAWNIPLIQHGTQIYSKRKTFVDQLIPVFQKYHEFISDGKEKVSLRYKSDLEFKDFEKILKESLPKDKVLLYTTKGVHKDDLIMEMEGNAIKKTGSQGQQKTYLVALKLAKYEFMGEKTGKKPILLLDDIFDKFDHDRVEKIIELLGRENFGQIFMTDTDPERLFTILTEVGHKHRIFNIDENRDIKQI